jgi:hypothetical protein
MTWHDLVPISNNWTMWIDSMCTCYEQSSWFGSMTWLCDCNSTLLCTSFFKNQVNFTLFTGFGLVHLFHHEKPFIEKLIRASNCPNRIVGPTCCSLNRQFAWSLFKSSNWISHPIYFSSDASIVQCSIFKINYFNGFSSVRAFQRYIICNFPLPFEPFTISDHFLLHKIEQAEKNSHGRREMNSCLCGTRRQWKKRKRGTAAIWVNWVYIIWTRMSYLMRYTHCTPGLGKISFLSKGLSSAKFGFPLFGISNLHPIKCWPQFAPTKALDQS